MGCGRDFVAMSTQDNALLVFEGFYCDNIIKLINEDDCEIVGLDYQIIHQYLFVVRQNGQAIIIPFNEQTIV